MSENTHNTIFQNKNVHSQHFHTPTEVKVKKFDHIVVVECTVGNGGTAIALLWIILLARNTLSL